MYVEMLREGQWGPKYHPISIVSSYWCMFMMSGTTLRIKVSLHYYGSGQHLSSLLHRHLCLGAFQHAGFAEITPGAKSVGHNKLHDFLIQHF